MDPLVLAAFGGHVKEAGLFGPSQRQRMEAVMDASKEELAGMSDKELAGGRHVPGLGSRVKKKFLGGVGELGEAFTAGMTKNVIQNKDTILAGAKEVGGSATEGAIREAQKHVTPDSFRNVGGYMGEGGAQAAERSFHGGKLMQYAKALSGGAKRVAKGGLAIGAVGTGIYGGSKLIGAHKNKKREDRIIEALRARGQQDGSQRIPPRALPSTSADDENIFA